VRRGETRIKLKICDPGERKVCTLMLEKKSPRKSFGRGRRGSFTTYFRGSEKEETSAWGYRFGCVLGKGGFVFFPLDRKGIRINLVEEMATSENKEMTPATGVV